MKIFFEKRGFGIEDVAYDNKAPQRRGIPLDGEILFMRGNDLFKRVPASAGGVALRNDDGLYGARGSDN